MLNPLALLDVARELSGDSSEPVSDEHLRRAVSTAYYALFHRLAGRAATTFTGQERAASGAYQLIYRNFEHRRIKDICKKLGLPRLDSTLRQQLGRASVGAEFKYFATIFTGLQEARHAADYDPVREFDRAEVSDLVNQAEDAIRAFDQVPPDEQADILALMMVRQRG